MYFLLIIPVAIAGFVAWCIYTAPRGEYDEDGGFRFVNDDDEKKDEKGK